MGKRSGILSGRVPEGERKGQGLRSVHGTTGPSPTPQEMNPRTREGGDWVLLPCFSSQVVNDLRLGNYDPITLPS